VRALVIDKVIRAPANGDTENEYCRLLNDLFPLLNSFESHLTCCLKCQ